MPRTNTIQDFWNNVDKQSNNCWQWQGSRDNDGYGRFQLDGIKWKCHRLSYTWAKGAIPKGLCVCHTCDNPTCVNPNHLWLGSPKDNNQDRSRKGRTAIHDKAIGESSGASILTEQDVLSIRTSNLSGQDLAKKYSVSDATIYSILHHKTWKHI
jgi:hypothetical protein